MENNFIQQRGHYRELIVYQKAECIYDITFYFAHKYLDKADRTIDQMILAARSVKQNIAEESAASSTWREAELKLTNVAKACLQELLIDYEDYLRVRNLEQWSVNSTKAMQTRMACRKHNDSAYFRKAIAVKSDETIANIAITLISSDRLAAEKAHRPSESRISDTRRNKRRDVCGTQRMAQTEPIIST